MAEAVVQGVVEGLKAHAPRTQWAATRVFVPHAGAAYALRRALCAEGLGLLPELVVLENPEPFALNLGLNLPPQANPWPVRAQAVGLLQTAYPHMAVAHLIPRAEELLQTLNLLAAYEVTPGALAASVPAGLQEIWQAQGGVLQSLWATVAPKAAQLLPAGRRASLWRGIEGALAAEPQSAPTVWWGEPPHEPPVRAVYERLLAEGMAVVPLGAVEGLTVPPLRYEAPHPFDEVQQAALWVAEQLEAGCVPVGVVATGAFAARLATELTARFGVVPRTTGGQRWAQTPQGSAWVQAARRWLGRQKELSLQYALEGLQEGLAVPLPLPPALAETLAPLYALPGRWAGDAAYAWLELALQALAPQDEETPQVGDERVRIVPPHRAVAQPFAALWVAECVEGVWPLASRPGALSMGQRRALGLPDAQHQAANAGALWQALMAQGAGVVVVSRSLTDEAGVKLAPSRWWMPKAALLTPRYRPAQLVAEATEAQAPTLGVWVPPVPPHELSASLLQALLACPYKAYGSRVLKLEPLPPLLPVPDARDKGVLIHTWLESAARHTPCVTAENAEALVAFMRAEAARLLADEAPLVRVLWQPRLRALAPAVVAWWQQQGLAWQTEVPLRKEFTLAEGHEERVVAVKAKADGVGVKEGACAMIVDYKTGRIFSQGEMASGAAPQLPLEGWLAAQGGQAPASLTYVQLKGYGEAPLVARPAAAEPLLAPVESSVQAVLARYYGAGQPWPAVPDPAGLGVMASGACKTCALAGVCRREACA